MIPENMKEYTQWLCWRLEGNSKPPYDPVTGKKSNFTRDFETVQAASQDYDGVSFRLKGTDPFCCLDLDRAINADGKLDPAATEIVSLFENQTYVEISQSGKGIHIICKGKIPRNIVKTKIGNGSASIEMYSKNQNISLTGNDYGGEHHEPAPMQSALDKLYKRYCRPYVNKVYRRQESNTGRTVAEALTFIENDYRKGGKTARKYKRLEAGCWEGDFHSHSEADYAFMSVLNFYADGNTSTMIYLFRQSELAKSVSDQHRHVNGQIKNQYLLDTVRAVQRNCRTTNRNKQWR